MISENRNMRSEEQNKIVSKKKLQLLIVVIFLFANIFLWSAVMRADTKGYLIVAILNVGQGDAIYIEAPNGNQILIDGGPGNVVLRELGSVMPFYDHSLDMVIATHPDQDHVGGLPAVLENMDINNVLVSEISADTGAYKTFTENVEKEGAHKVLARAGEKIILDEGVVLEILFPDRNTSGWETNVASVVARLSYGNKTFLFTGDSPIAVEKYLIGLYGANLESTVLKLGHHGSRTSSSREFVSIVSPEYGIVSSGKDNKYGHPHKEVLSILDSLGIKELNTAQSGRIIFKTNGEDLLLN